MSDRIADLAPTVVTDKIQFGKILRAARLTSGIDALDAAKSVYIAKSTLATRELGTRGLSVGDAVEMLDLYGYALIVAPKDRIADAVTDPEA